MSRSLIALIVVLVLVIGGLFVLAGRAGDKPVTHVEKAVDLGNLAS